MRRNLSGVRIRPALHPSVDQTSNGLKKPAAGLIKPQRPSGPEGQRGPAAHAEIFRSLVVFAANGATDRARLTRISH
ncbi:hypothetical protein BN77_3286 [Rhizobium mesoamericanum STM3625]|uniref:Uncharacterized protein n=1 Tax=Rhizobium mesoamericanum STM3625 TaxID=1211777 RepID=K0PWZ7_9HYPH|nr:hypothetical protein BN77_3286 [Rhizobium mesoamericanum STM3625]